MTLMMRLSLGAAAVLLLTEGASAQDPLNVLWKDSLRFENESGDTKLRLAGRFHQDWVWVDEDDEFDDAFGSENFEDGVEFRRARTAISGTVADNVEFILDFGFEGGDVDFKDVFLGIKDLFGSGGGVRVGHYKEPFSLEWQTSSNNLTFMERSLVYALSPIRGTGAMYHSNTGERGQETGTFSVGVFRTPDSFGDAQEDAGYSFTSRATTLFMDDEDSEDLVHVGVAATYRGGDEIRFLSPPEVQFLPNVVDTGAIDQKGTLTGSVEALGIFGPFSVQGEYVMTSVMGDDSDDFDARGFYLQASYILTGEQRRFNRKWGAPVNPKPAEPFSGLEGTGPGAWEAALRISQIDLTDGAIVGGELFNLTAGLNWYLNNNARVVFNYVHADHDELDAVLDALAIRFQFAF